MTDQEHVEVLRQGGFIANEQVVWQPAQGPETLRLLERSLHEDEARQRTARQAVGVLERCNPPAVSGASPRTGLVVGHVQSGKTLSFTTLIALARDNGFPLVVLFAGTRENLHMQTARRLAHDLEVERPGGMAPWYLATNPRPKSAEAQSIAQALEQSLRPETPERFRRTVVVTVMKNSTRLGHLREVMLDLAGHGISTDDMPVLVIDDEADQAGLNTLVGDDDMSDTYRAIVNLRNAFPSHSYVMYTATPQAPLLVNLADTLSPDFVVVLEPGNGYTGGEYFFVDHQDTFLETIRGSELVGALDPAVPEPPASLQQSLATYLLGVVVRGQGPVSMLVHPSHTRDLHGKYETWVRALCETWRETLTTAGPDRDALVEEVFRPAYERLLHGATLPPLDELLREMPYWIGTTQVRVVNSDNPEDSLIRWNVSPSWILVGGNKLDRGFTVEGLTVTYMPRGAGVGNADTVQQRARFFGYKDAYAHLCRAWLADETATALLRYVEHERVLRKELQEVALEGISLKQWKRRMLLDPAFKPCRRAVIDIPYFHGRVKGDSWTQLRRLVSDQSWIDVNRSALEAFIVRHGDGRQPDARDDRTSDRNMVFSVNLDAVLDMLADWRAPVEDRALLNVHLLLLRARLDDDPSLTADIYLMRGLQPRDRARAKDGSVNNLFEGRRSVVGSGYPGDQAFFTDGRVSVQAHHVNVKEGNDVVAADVMGLALWVPKQLAGGYLAQVDI